MYDTCVLYILNYLRWIEISRDVTFLSLYHYQQLILIALTQYLEIKAKTGENGKREVREGRISPRTLGPCVALPPG